MCAGGEGGDEDKTLTFDEFMARKLERERLERLAILTRQVGRHGESVVRNALHLAPAWVRLRLEDGTEPEPPRVGPDGEVLPAVDTGTYYWCGAPSPSSLAPCTDVSVCPLFCRLNNDTGQSVWEVDMLDSCSRALTNEQVVDSDVPVEEEEEEDEISTASSSVADHRYSSGSEDDKSEFSNTSESDGEETPRDKRFQKLGDSPRFKLADVPLPPGRKRRGSDDS